MKIHKFAKVPEEYQGKDHIIWLRLIDRTSEGKGVAILLYDGDLSEHCKYDDWFLKLEHAISATEEGYGIKPEDRIPSEKLKETGIDIIEEE